MIEFDYLPSGFLQYAALRKANGNALYMRVFSGKELPMLSKAASSGKYIHLVEALTSAIESDIDAKDLTIGDFYYLLAWQRLNAYPNNKMVAVWQCDGELYANQETGDMYTASELLELPEDMMSILVKSVPCGHINHYDIEFDDIGILPLTENLNLDPRIKLPTAGLIDQMNEAVSNEDTMFIAPAAAWIAEGDTIEDKISILLQQDTMELFDVASEANATVVHGVSTSITKQCARCGKSAANKFTLTPDSFFWT